MGMDELGEMDRKLKTFWRERESETDRQTDRQDREGGERERQRWWIIRREEGHEGI